jgi:CubicO group peptidase (beta-lactamase class C family)
MVINISCGTSKATLFPVFSAGKPVLAVLLLQAVEQNLITLDTPIAELWQEFGTPDKREITLEHLLSHRAGLYLLPSGQPDLTDWNAMCSKIAAMPARNIPGAKCHYHPLTFGWLVGHTLELATGKPLQQLMREYVLEPAGVTEEIFFGIDDRYTERIVPVDDTLIAAKPAWEAIQLNNPAIRKCGVPSFSGIGNAAGLAKFFSVLRGKIVSDSTFDYATKDVFRADSDPLKPNDWSAFALGVILPGPPENRRMFCGHSGAAGAEGFYMPETDVAFGFVKNRLSPRHPDQPVRDKISAALGIPCRVW